MVIIFQESIITGYFSDKTMNMQGSEKTRKLKEKRKKIKKEIP